MEGDGEEETAVQYILNGSNVCLESIDLQTARQLLLEKENFFIVRQIPYEVNWPTVALRAFLPLYMEQLETVNSEGYGPWVIREQTLGNVIGEIYLKNVSGSLMNVFDLGYHIIDKYRNKGYATEAVSLITEWATHHQIKKIVAYCNHSNIASQHVLMKNRFFQTEKSREFVFFERTIQEK